MKIDKETLDSIYTEIFDITLGLVCSNCGTWLYYSIGNIAIYNIKSIIVGFEQIPVINYGRVQWMQSQEIKEHYCKICEHPIFN
jgi:hypothetical protein